MEGMGISKTDDIYCDSAEPDRIPELCNTGYNAKPSRKDVKAGIDFVKGSTIHVDATCSPNISTEYNNYKWKETKDGKSLDEPVKAFDHICFVAGTMITTLRGDIPIEYIRADDMILTRDGYMPILEHGITSECAEVCTLVCNDGRILTGTPNHPIWVDGAGWVCMDALRYNDILEPTYNNVWHQKQLSTKELSSDDIQNQRMHLIRDTLDQDAQTFSWASGTCIKRYGSPNGAKSQKDVTYTTKTEIVTIIPLKILSASMESSTCPCTEKNDSKTQSNIKNNVIDLCNTKILQKNGTDQTKGENGTANMQKRFTNQECHSAKSVSNVVQSLTTSTEAIKHDSVQTIANQHGGEQLELITNPEYVETVGNNSQLTNTQKREHVLRVAQLRRQGRHERVYNLTVDDAHEYYANGVLVHNCDSVRYAMFTAPTEPVKAVSKVQISRPSFSGFASSRPHF